ARGAEPVRARPASPWERGLKWARRRPGRAAVVVGLLLALAGAAAGGLLFLDQWARRVGMELQEQRRVQGRRDEVQGMLFLGQQAAAAGQWEEGRHHLAGAQAVIETEPALADLGEPGRRVLAEGVAQLHRHAGGRPAP